MTKHVTHPSVHANDQGDLVDAAEAFRKRFGDVPSKIIKTSEIRHTWGLSFLANYLNLPLYRDLIKTTDLSRPQIVTLFSLSECDGLQASEICLISGQPKNSISRAVIDLRKRGLITQKNHSVDKRAKHLHLTEAGSALLEQILNRFLARQSAMRAILSEDELEVFDRLLAKLLFAMPSWVDDGVEVERLDTTPRS
ncbi:MarR family winged helix-turn-helix transcriptional regulator [Seohaeicola saemankumensis]|uniref:MarR family winged helix-turn-helix transcriptional regulator n=1 Tax=Seohaeicola saemankumensis TaxID=481181 RepID=UPI0035D0B8AC